MACEICTRATHEWYDCPKKQDGYVPLARRGVHQESTAARKDVLAIEDGPLPRAQQTSGQFAIAGTQARPVDTKRNADRHRPGYFADYQRQRRAKLKEAK